MQSWSKQRHYTRASLLSDTRVRQPLYGAEQCNYRSGAWYNNPVFTFKTSRANSSSLVEASSIKAQNGAANIYTIWPLPTLIKLKTSINTYIYTYYYYYHYYYYCVVILQQLRIEEHNATKALSSVFSQGARVQLPRRDVRQQCGLLLTRPTIPDAPRDQLCETMSITRTSADVAVAPDPLVTKVRALIANTLIGLISRSTIVVL